MSQQATTCPTSDTGYHRYFIFKTFDSYEPAGKQTIDGEIQDIYIKSEYAVCGCNCGSVIKRPVKGEA